MGKGTCRSYRAPCCGILDTQLSFLFSGKKLVKKYAQNPESYPGRYKYLKHYSFSFCFVKIAAPKHDVMGDVVSYFHTCYFYTNVLLIVKNIFTAFHNSAHRRGTQ